MNWPLFITVLHRRWGLAWSSPDTASYENTSEPGASILLRLEKERFNGSLVGPDATSTEEALQGLQHACVFAGMIRPEFVMPREDPAAQGHEENCAEALTAIQVLVGPLSVPRREAIARKLAPIFSKLWTKHSYEARRVARLETALRTLELACICQGATQHLADCPQGIRTTALHEG